MKRLVIVTAFLVVVFLAWQFWSADGSNPETNTASRGPQHSEASDPQPKTQNSKPPAPPEPREIADALNTPSGDILADLRIVN